MTVSMARIQRAVFVSILLCMGVLRTTDAGMNEWSTVGPEGGTVVTLAIDPQAPSTLYAGTRESGVFKSTDGGGSWRSISNGMAYANGVLTILDLAIDPQNPATLYAGTSSAGIYKSTDGGASWRAVNNGLPYLVILDLVIDPQSPATLYASTQYYGVYKSTDGGENWISVNNGLPVSPYVHALAVDPRTPSTLYAGTDNFGVFKSTDGGSSWSGVNSGLGSGCVSYGNDISVLTLSIDPRTPATVYAGTYAHGVHKSTDGGASWSPANLGLPNCSQVNFLAIDPQTPTTLYAGAYGNGIFKSIDGGGSWLAVNHGLPRLVVFDAAVDPGTPATVYAALLGGGACKSTDGGASWSAINAGLTGISVETLAIDPQSAGALYAGTTEGGIYKRADAGGTWSAASNGLTSLSIHVVALDPQSPTTLYAGTDYRGLFKSTDGGGSWSQSRLPNLIVYTVAIDLQTPNTLYAGTNYDSDVGGGVYKSTDGGVSWGAVNTGLTSRRVLTLAIDPRTPTTLYAGTYPDPLGAVFKSDDGGGSWRAVNTGLPNIYIGSLAIDPRTPTTLYAGTGWDGVYKSTDGGGQWVPTGPAGTHVTSLLIDPQTPATVYAGTLGDGVFESADGGASWKPLNPGLYNLMVRDLAFDPLNPATLYAGTSAGVFVLQQQENRPPVADAGADQVVEPDGPDGATIILDGSGSSDPDGDPLTFGWSWPSGQADGVRPSVRLPVGTTEVTLVVSDSHGATASDAVLVTVGQDATPAAVALGSPSDGEEVRGTINLTASASDAVGVAGVQFLIDGAPLGPEDTWTPYEVPWDTRTAPDGTHRLSARARDFAGNLADSATVSVTVANGPIPTLTLARFEEGAATLAPTDAWTETDNDGAQVALSGSRAVYASAAGATATLTFTGTGVRWIGFPCERCGIADVLIDGARVATVDTFDLSRPAYSKTMYTSPPLAAGSHTLAIEVTGIANTSSVGPFVVVDAFDVTLDGAGALPPIPPVPRLTLGTYR